MRKSNQIFVRLQRVRNKKTGEERVVSKVKLIDYEFECEALADFAYSLST